MTARKNNTRQANAHSATDTAASPPSALSADPPAGGPAAAVWAALAATPEATASGRAPGEADCSPPDAEATGSAAIAAPGAEDAPAADDAIPAPAGSEPQPAAASEAGVLLREVATAGARAADALERGDMAGALATTDAICAAAARSRRLLKSAASGRTPRSPASATARPGQLRDLVRGHLAAYPAADFTPHQIGLVPGRSSGAVANALDRLTALGQAQLTSEKPRRYQATEPVSGAATAT